MILFYCVKGGNYSALYVKKLIWGSYFGANNFIYPHSINCVGTFWVRLCQRAGQEWCDDTQGSVADARCPTLVCTILGATSCQWTVTLKTWRHWCFSQQLGISRLQDIWIALDKQYGVILWFYHEQCCPSYSETVISYSLLITPYKSNTFIYYFVSKVIRYFTYLLLYFLTVLYYITFATWPFSENSDTACLAPET